MGSNSSSGGGGGGGNQQAKARRLMTTTPNYQKPKKKAADYNPEKDDSSYYKTREFENAGAEKIKKGVRTPSILVNLGAAILSKPLQAGSIKTRKYFREKVLGKGGYKKTDQSSFDAMSRSAQESMYKSYIDGRNSGKTDAYGDTLSQGDNGGATGSSGQVVQAPKVNGPTTAEVSQVSTTPEVTSEEARATANELIKKKRRGRGRSLMVATSPQGVTDEKLTLSEKTLLG